MIRPNNTTTFIPTNYADKPIRRGQLIAPTADLSASMSIKPNHFLTCHSDFPMYQSERQGVILSKAKDLTLGLRKVIALPLLAPH